MRANLIIALMSEIRNSLFKEIKIQNNGFVIPGSNNEIFVTIGRHIYYLSRILVPVTGDLTIA